MGERPWGNYRVLCRENGFQVKRIEIKPHCRFSLQKHNRRRETWIIVSGGGLATLGGGSIPVGRGSVVKIAVEEVHRMENTGREPLVFIEIQFGEYLEEDDIVRLEDDYSRA